MRAAGTIVLKSTYHGNMEVDFSSLVVDEITLIGSRCGPFVAALQLLGQGLVEHETLISKSFGLNQGLQAMEYAARPGVLKTLIVP